MNRRTLHLVLLGSWMVPLVWSAIQPHDYMTWVLETFPCFIGLAVLIPTYRRMPLTTLTYVLIWIHATILVVGGHYTYANVPAGNWVRDALELQRNPYDRLGHFVQGFIPAIIAREVFIRVGALRPGKWLFFHVTCFCLAFSALYELIEWWSAVAFGDGAAEFLGSQGDVWDAQWDMFTCLIGAIVAQLVLARYHDRQIRKLETP